MLVSFRVCMRAASHSTYSHLLHALLLPCIWWWLSNSHFSLVLRLRNKNICTRTPWWELQRPAMKLWHSGQHKTKKGFQQKEQKSSQNSIHPSVTHPYLAYCTNWEENSYTKLFPQDRNQKNGLSIWCSGLSGGCPRDWFLSCPTWTFQGPVS